MPVFHMMCWEWNEGKELWDRLELSWTVLQTPFYLPRFYSLLSLTLHRSKPGFQLCRGAAPGIWGIGARLCSSSCKSIFRRHMLPLRSGSEAQTRITGPLPGPQSCPTRWNVLRVSVDIVNPVTMDFKFVFLTVKLWASYGLLRVWVQTKSSASGSLVGWSQEAPVGK